MTFAIDGLLSSGVAQGSSRMLKGSLTGLYSACIDPVLLPVYFGLAWIVHEKERKSSPKQITEL
jgi:hypothetical protein